MGVRDHRQRYGRGETRALGALPDADILRALRDLPDEEKLAVYLADVQGYPYTQIAEITGTSVRTVAIRLHQARGRLRDRLAASAAARGLAPAPG
jgi:RNA polymerase sigma-70 factor (ECF subfamily)